ncbi:T9SS type A sorting domain-containing protein [Kordia sp. TARA_039_SRF]|nr:T9SS type A sorting domain-containing protein [Kordia sp. TARA_039_SRF]
MKNISFVFFFIVSSVYAQLTVRDDNYIFVTDQVLFVNDNVNLGETNSKMYLRNDAQLIQGTGTTGNTGVGELSIYQNGTTHNYAFNYWCSPVGDNLASFGNENFRANLIDDATGLITSTDATFTNLDGTSSPLVIASYWIYTFENSAQFSDWVQQGATGTIAPGLGFTMKGTSGSGNNQLYDFRGKPNNGTIANSVADGEWTLVGNPYPSALDAVAYIHDTDNVAAITGTLYYWEQDLSVLSHSLDDYVGGYATYTINAAGTIETFVPATFDTYNSDGSLNTAGSSSTSGKQARRYIPVGQGFMVEGSVGSTGTVQTKNAHRVYYKQSNTDSEFFRPANSDNEFITENEQNTANTEETSPYGEIPDDYKRFRLNIDFNDVYTRQLVQTFHDTEATTGFDYGLESKSPSGVANDAYWTINQEPFIAQALPFAIDLSIPLHIKLSTNSNIRIRLFDVQHFESNQPIFIWDTETGIYTDIRQLPFEINLPQGEYAHRFEVVFARNTLSTEDITADTFQVVQNIIQKELIIQNPNKVEMNRIELYDILGKLIWSDTDVKTTTRYTINTSSLSENVYILKIKNKDTSIFAKKIIVKN